MVSKEDLDNAILCYHDVDGIAYPVFNIPASQHEPPIPDIPTNRGVLDLLRKNFPERV